MNPFEMVLGIIIVVTIGKVLQARYGVRKDRWGSEYPRPVSAGVDAAENARLQQEIRSLKERIQVLERVITDNNRSLELDREIEALRDRTRA